MSRRRFVFLVSFVFVLLVSAYFSVKIIDEQTSYTMGIISSNTPVIIIDPGHGGIDGGASSDDNIKEKDLNLAISLKLRDLFVLSGFEVIMTRETDKSIHDSTAVTIKQQKTSDLKNRLKILNNTPNSFFLSIHQNYFEESKYWGAQMFYSSNVEASEQLASYLQSSFISRLQPESKREHKEAGNSLYLLNKAENPSVLIECGFLSNEKEATQLKTEEYQNEIVFTIFSGFMEYLQSVSFS